MRFRDATAPAGIQPFKRKFGAFRSTATAGYSMPVDDANLLSVDFSFHAELEQLQQLKLEIEKALNGYKVRDTNKPSALKSLHGFASAAKEMVTRKISSVAEKVKTHLHDRADEYKVGAFLLITAATITGANMLPMHHDTIAPKTEPAAATAKAFATTPAIAVKQEAKAALIEATKLSGLSDTAKSDIALALKTGSEHMAKVAFQDAARQVGLEQGADKAEKFLQLAVRYDNATGQNTGVVYDMTKRDLNYWSGVTKLSHKNVLTKTL